jgi:hypothetical protein
MTSVSIEIERPAAEVFSYATDPSRFPEWQRGVASGSMESKSGPVVGDHWLTTRRIGGAERPATSDWYCSTTARLGGARHRWADPRAGRRLRRSAHGPAVAAHDRCRLEGHGIGKMLVPLVVRRQARAEMPGNIAKLKERMETPPIGRSAS